MKLNLIPAGKVVYSWESQAWQYPPTATTPDAIVYHAGNIEGALPIDCLLYYGHDGKLQGILNHYPQDYPPFEKKCNVNIFVHPLHRRQGIATRLVDTALKRWSIDVEQQQYSGEGMVFIRRYIKRQEQTGE